MSKSILIITLLLCSTLAFSLPSKKKNGKGQIPIDDQIDWECEYEGVFPYPDACDKFVECWAMKAVLWQCTDDMLFDITYLGCNYAEYTHCYDRPRPTNVPSTLQPTTPTTTRDPNATTTPPPDDEFDCPSDGVFPHEEKCEYYWQCGAGEATLVHCQSNFLFDLTYNGCNYPEYTHCGDRERPEGYPPTLFPPITTTTAETTSEGTGPTTTISPNATTTQPPVTTTSKPGFQCPGPDGDYPDPEDCRGFYTCVGGVPYHNMCPDGLYFNPETDSCDYPDNVDCQMRKI